MKKNIIGLLLAFALILTIAVPGALVVRADENEPAPTETVPAVTETKPAETEAEPAPTETQTEPAPTETEPVPTETVAAPAETAPAPTETVPVPAETEPAPAHIDGCSDECEVEGCTCPCHLFNKIMACTTLDDIWAAFDEASDETVNALTDEQNAQIDAKIEALEPAPAPAVVIEESNEETVPSEIVYRTVNYTFVASFGDPVTGGHR